MNDVVTLEDLNAVDEITTEKAQTMRDIDQPDPKTGRAGLDAETFEYAIFETFSTTSLDGRVVDLKPGGRDIDVTFDTRHEYADLIEEYRMNEFSVQAEAIRRGLATIVPQGLLALFSWTELESMVCGESRFDVELLKRNTTYSGGTSSSSPHVVKMWEVLEGFDSAESKMFLRFIWGRARLPLRDADFFQKFTIMSFSRGGGNVDNYLPIAHTCFFQFELPEYSTVEIMAAKIRYAMFNCTAIDGDDTSTAMEAASMGWEAGD